MLSAIMLTAWRLGAVAVLPLLPLQASVDRDGAALGEELGHVFAHRAPGCDIEVVGATPRPPVAAPCMKPSGPARSLTASAAQTECPGRARCLSGLGDRLVECDQAHWAVGVLA